jgi:hypothetical protein
MVGFKKPLKIPLFLLDLQQHCMSLKHLAEGQVAHSSGWYDAHAADLVRRYELVDPAKLYGWLSGLLSEAPGTVPDLGAGSGRDAAWFAAHGMMWLPSSRQPECVRRHNTIILILASAGLTTTFLS